MAVNRESKFNVTTKIQHYCEFEWWIDDFSVLSENLISPTFQTAEDCPLKWTLILEFGYTRQTNVVILKFEVLDQNKIDITGTFAYDILTIGGSVMKHGSVEDIFDYINENRGIEIHVPHYNSLVNRRANKFNYVGNRNDQIKFQGNMTITNCCQVKPKIVEVPNKYLPQLQIDFKSLLKNQQFTDVVLNVGNEVIRVHKFVLCARSPVFKRMFEQNFKEAVNNSVDVEDMEKAVLENFLEFLYSGVLEDRKFSTVTALYSAADKYEVKTLQDACREILVTCLSENTAPEILKLADMHNDNNLKELAIIFICDNFVKVELTSQWSQLLDTDPRLSSHTLRRVSAHISKN